MSTTREPFFREDDDELVGYIVHDATGWQVQTVFGYTIARVPDQATAQKVLREQGLSFLLGVWQYRDPDDREWHACVIKEAYEHRVVVMRTNEMGYQDPDDHKVCVLEPPFDDILVKAS